MRRIRTEQERNLNVDQVQSALLCTVYKHSYTLYICMQSSATAAMCSRDMRSGKRRPQPRRAGQSGQ